MPRFFDDYSNTYLTHDSAAGRKQQRRGWKFRENFKLHYEAHIDDWRKGPMGLASAQQAYVRAKGREDPMIAPLPDGWKEDADEATGMTFYSHDESGERSWVRPNFIPPPPGPPGGRGPPPNQNFRGGFRGGPPPGHNGGPPPGHNGGPPPGHNGNNRPPPFYGNQQHSQQQGPPPNMQYPPPQPNNLQPPPFPGGPPPPQFRQPPPQQQFQAPPQPGYPGR
jgi:U1 small nuclear ribonucleoprotein C